VAARYGVRPGDITGAGRARQIARARQTALLLGRRLTGHSLVALGGMVGGRDHSTVLYGIRQAEERCEQDAEYARDIADIAREIRT
jgi:chromosomal replication initiator protein